MLHAKELRLRLVASVVTSNVDARRLWLKDTALRLVDRLVDISFCGLSASLYRAYTVQLTAIMEDMEFFFAYLVLYKIADRAKAG